MGRGNAGGVRGRALGLWVLLLLLLFLWAVEVEVEGQNVSFGFGASEFSSADLVLLGDAFINGDKNLELTQDSVIRQLESSVGRVLYRDPVRMFDQKSGKVASFHTSFEFRITNTSEVHGDGLAFVLVPDNSTLGSYGGWLGVLNSTSDGQPGSRTLAVELDTFQNGDPIFDPDGNHVGIDLNAMRSIATANMSAIGMGLLNGNNIKVWVDYDGNTKSLQVSINNFVPPAKPSSPILSLPLDLSRFLNEFMYVGFAAATGGLIEIHTIFSWTFSSSGLPDSPTQTPLPLPADSPLTTSLPPAQQIPDSISISPSPAPGPAGGAGRRSSGCGSFLCRKPFVVAFSSALGAVLATSLGICFLLLFRRRAKEAGAAAGQNSDSEIVNGPRKFSFKELSVATKNFSARKLLGSGGSGTVYMGVLPDCGTVVAVKRISATNRTGRREFTAELSIISRLRHRNLVPLRGWCSAKGQLLLVYDYMSNGSLDKLLFSDLGSNARGHSSSDSGGSTGGGAVGCAAGGAGGAAREGLLWTWRRRESKRPPPVAVVGAAGAGPSCGGGFVLSWERRFRIVNGVAAALAYLHEGWDQRVVHRDVKASNVMLDGGFNARLGDFGLARASEHSRQPETTVIVGTFGYLAPESTHTGKATDKTDVFSFGAVALEVACGRRPVEREYPVAEVVLVDWVWALNKQGRLLEAADARLQGSFDPVEMTTLLQVGLACSHPDPVQRPSMRQVLQVLAGDASLPALPSSKPTPQYSAVLHPPVTMQDIIAQLDFSQSHSMSNSFSGHPPPPED